MSGLGPPPLSAGTRVALADPAPVAPIPPGDLHPWGRPPDALEIALAPGPRATVHGCRSPTPALDRLRRGRPRRHPSRRHHRSRAPTVAELASEGMPRVRSRCRRTGCPSSSAPTARSPAATPSSPS
jgi:hypothetical protein